MRALCVFALWGLWAFVYTVLSFAPFAIAVALVVLILRWMGVIQ